VAGENVVGDPESEQHGLSGIVDAQQERIADGLDPRSPEDRQLGFDGIAEVGHQPCGLLVAVCLGQGGEAGDVGKHERRADRIGLGGHTLGCQVSHRSEPWGVRGQLNRCQFARITNLVRPRAVGQSEAHRYSFIDGGDFLRNHSVFCGHAGRSRDAVSRRMGRGVVKAVRGELCGSAPGPPPPSESACGSARGPPPPSGSAWAAPSWNLIGGVMPLPPVPWMVAVRFARVRLSQQHRQAR
jgi:hypothetical protein